MGFKSREKKRKAKAAQSRAQSEARRSGSSAGKWWLTIVTQDTCCARCGGILRTGRDMVYRHTPREARCTACATGVSFRPSMSWERARRRARA